MSEGSQAVRLIRESAGRMARLALILWVLASPLLSETWMGLEVEPENRCSAYNRSRDYRYSQSLEPAIAVPEFKFYNGDLYNDQRTIAVSALQARVYSP